MPKDFDLQGGEQIALEFLRQAMGEEKSKSFAEKFEQKEIRKKFAELENFSLDDIVTVLSKEMEQTITLVLSLLPAKLSGKVLSKLPDKQKVLVTKKMIALREVPPQSLELIYNTLSQKLEDLKKNEGLPSGGEKHLAQILRHLDLESGSNIMENLNQEDPEMAERIQAQIYNFEELEFLPAKELRQVIEAIPEIDIWAMALKGAKNNLRQHILSVLSINRSSDIVLRMQELGAVPIKEIEKNRRAIMKKIEELEDDGLVLLRKENESYTKE